jgi:hypothetical protein
MSNFSFGKFSLFIFFTLLISSCQPDDPIVINDTFSKGVFVVNQGPFQTGTGTITYKADNIVEPDQDIFGQNNAGSVLGNIAQSMIKFDNKYYIAVNNANKVIVTDEKFKLLATINDVALPRYFATDGTKLYLSTWGADFASGKIVEINTATNTIKTSINVGNAPEQMLIDNGKLYVTLSSPYGGDSDSIAIINIATNVISEKKFVGDSPTAIAKDANGDIWVLCSGNYAFNPADNTNGALVNINKPSTKTFILNNGASSLVTNVAKDKLYFISGDKVNDHSIDASTLSTTFVYQGNAYALGVSTDDVLHVADPKDYKSQGVIHTIHLQTKAVSEFTAGIAPGYFYFED